MSDTAQMAETGERLNPRGFWTFWTSWTLPKAMLFGWFALWRFATLLYYGMGVESPDWWGPIVTVVTFLFVWNWLFNDSQRFPEIASHYGGFGLYILWPLVLPMYMVETRGWRRTFGALFFSAVLWVALALVGAAAVTLLGGG
jgi:hypothetical protein